MKKKKALAKIKGSPVRFWPRKSSKRPKSAFTRKRGRPTLTDPELEGRRDHLVYVLETYWPRIGWRLKTARDASVISRAFEPIRGNVGEDRVGIFLRLDSTKSSSILIHKLQKTLVSTLEGEARMQKDYQEKFAGYQLAVAGVSEGSPETRLNLKNEITFRLKNIRNLEKDFTANEKELRTAEDLMGKTEAASRQGKPVDLHGIKIAYQGVKALNERSTLVLNDEREILRALKERLRAASPGRLKLAMEIACERQERLKEAQTQLAQAGIERGRIEKTLRDHQAGFAQFELLRFIRSKRAKHSPRALANAIAGLPEISARVSFRRCRKFPFAADPGLNMQVFDFIGHCMRKRTSTRTAHILELFRSEIELLPKTRLMEAGRVENYFRKHMEGNWWALKAAITDSLKSKQHPGELPYIVTASFQRNLSKPLTNLDRLLFEEETLGR